MSVLLDPRGPFYKHDMQKHGDPEHLEPKKAPEGRFSDVRTQEYRGTTSPDGHCPRTIWARNDISTRIRAAAMAPFAKNAASDLPRPRWRAALSTRAPFTCLWPG